MSGPAAAQQSRQQGRRRRRRRRRSCAAPLAFMALNRWHTGSALYVGEQQLAGATRRVPQGPKGPEAPEAPASQSPPPSIANVGGTVPERVVVEFESSDGSSGGGGGRYDRNRRGESFVWVDRLDREACRLASDQWHRHRNSPPMTDTSSTVSTRPFSLLSWNILSQPLYRDALFSWEERLEWILHTISDADSDVVCLQEVESYDTYLSDLLPAMHEFGYDGTVQGHADCRDIKRRAGKGDRRHLVATFWKRRRFRPVNVTDSNGVGFAHMARGRTLTCNLQDVSGEEEGADTDSDMNTDKATVVGPCLAVVNCHLEGHPRQYAARMRQLQHAMEDLAQRRTRGPALNGLVIAGDFNCELQSSACSTYLRIGRVGRKGGLGGVHGTSALALPASLLESEEAAEVLSPVLEWGHAIPNDDMENVKPHPFRRNSMVSAYPPHLGQRDPRLHFTYCRTKHRPVAGLDQIWHSGFTLTRVALRKMFATQQARKSILKTGLPAPVHPSDHLPIGAVFDWNTCDPMECVVDSSRQTCADFGVRELFVTQDRARPTPKPKSPMVAFAELDLLLCTCPYDSKEQREELMSIIEHVPDLPPNNQKPSQEQLQKLRNMRERKKLLLANATEPVRDMLRRILKLSKETAGMY